MPWPVHPNGLLGAQGDNDAYKVERSLRFNSADSAHLARTTSASFTSRRIFTFSFWCKRSKLSSDQSIFDRNQASNTNQFAVEFNVNDAFVIAARTSGTTTLSLHLTTSAVFRDTSAWYHFMISVDNTQAALGDRGKIYVNGVLQSLGTQTATQNVDYHLLTGLTYDIGRTAITNSQYFDGYLAEVYFIDGQQLTPSSFGKTDAVTGRWKAKAYSGTYGNNGFYLSFKDNTSTTTLGYDDAGSNDWTLNNFSVTAGAGNDSLVDTPTNYGTDTGVGGEVRGNYCVINPLDFIIGSGTLSEGNLKWTTVTTGNRINRGTVAVLSGKWYWEITADSVGAGACLVGVAKTSSYSIASGLAAYQSNTGDSFIDNVTADYGSTWATGVIIGISYDADAGKITFYKNNVSQGELTLSGYAGVYVSPIFYDGSSLAFSLTANFGQRPFAYTAPTGFKALCTTNLIKATAITTSGSFVGNVSADGPFVYLNGIPTAMTINGNAVTFGSQADKLSNGFKVRTTSTSYNSTGTNNFSVSTTAQKFKYARAQAN